MVRKKNSDGEGSIRKKAVNGKVYLEGRIMIDGITHSVSGKTEKEIRQGFARLKVLGPPKKEESTKETIEDCVNNYLDEVKSSKKQSTYLNYQGCAETYISPVVGNIALQKFTRSDGQKLINKWKTTTTVQGKKGLSPNTIRRIYLILSAALKLAVKDEKINRNVMEYVEIPKIEKKKVETISKENLMKITAYDATGDTMATLSQILLLTGLRRGEGLGLKWSDVNFKSGTVKVQRAVVRGDKEILITTPKNATSFREVPLPKQAIQILEKHRLSQNEKRKKLGPLYQNRDFIFPGSDGTPSHPDAVRKGLHRLLTAVKVPLTYVHALRHSYASLLFELGEDGKVIQSVLGHSSIKTTMDIYVRLKEETKKEAADKIDSLLNPEAKNKRKK